MLIRDDVLNPRLPRRVMSSTAARLLAASRQQNSFTCCFLCEKNRTGCQPFGTLTTPSDKPASHDLQTGSVEPTPPTSTSTSTTSTISPNSLLPIKSTFLFLHFTAMSLVNPARPGEKPPSSSSSPPSSSSSSSFCDVQ